jgi:hypothetical protein
LPTDYHIFGARRPGSARRNLARCWEREEAENLASKYRRDGWVRVVIRELTHEVGRCVRSMVVRNPQGRWVEVMLAEDVEVVAEAFRDATDVYIVLRKSLDPDEAEQRLVDWLALQGYGEMSRRAARDVRRAAEQ